MPQADFVDPTVAKPRGRLASLKLQTLRRLKPAVVLPPKEGPVRFVSGPLMAMRKGQCRYPISDDTYCGARAVAGRSWCSHHDDVVHGRLVMEAAE